MPKVKVKYKLTIDNTITAIDHLKFAVKHIDYDGDRVSDTLWAGEVDGAVANDKIQVNMLLGGAVGEWSLEVSVIEVDDDGDEIGDWKKLVEFPIEGNVSSVNQISERKPIDWS